MGTFSFSVIRNSKIDQPSKTRRGRQGSIENFGSDSCESQNTTIEDQQAKKPLKLVNLVKIRADPHFDDHHH